MLEERLLVGIASTCSLTAIVACLLSVGSFYSTISEIHQDVIDAVTVFRFETDSAWTEIMSLQAPLNTGPRSTGDPFESIFRRKRRQQFSSLPDWCQCVPTKPKCPPGPAGPPGHPGEPGRLTFSVSLHACLPHRAVKSDLLFRKTRRARKAWKGQPPDREGNALPSARRPMHQVPCWTARTQGTRR